MAAKKTLTFRIHGLAHEKSAVDAAVFARKLSAIVRGLAKADTTGNRRRCLEFVIADLRMGSAVASIEERQANVKYPPRVSGIDILHDAAVAIVKGNGQSLNGSAELLPAFKSLSQGASRGFSHIEVFIDDDEDTAVRVDGFFAEQVVVAREAIRAIEARSKRRLFKGKSKTTLDGTLKAVDHRGATKLALLVLTAGGAEIECVYNEHIAPAITPAFDKRCRVEAWAHYDGISPLPRRLELISAVPLKTDPDLVRWRGAFVIPVSDVDEWAD